MGIANLLYLDSLIYGHDIYWMTGIIAVGVVYGIFCLAWGKGKM